MKHSKINHASSIFSENELQTSNVKISLSYFKTFN